MDRMMDRTLVFRSIDGSLPPTHHDPGIADYSRIAPSPILGIGAIFHRSGRRGRRLPIVDPDLAPLIRCLRHQGLG